MSKHNGALESASEKLRDDEEIVSYSVSQDGMSLSWASKRLKNNEVIVNKAVSNKICALMYAGERFRNDEKRMLEFAEKDMRAALDTLGENLKLIRDLC